MVNADSNQTDRELFFFMKSGGDRQRSILRRSTTSFIWRSKIVGWLFNHSIPYENYTKEEIRENHANSRICRNE